VSSLKSKVRSAEHSASVQDYLAAIYDLAGGGQPVIGARLAKHLRVSAPAVTEALQRMARAGYIRLGAGKVIALTRKGKALAEVMARRHRLLERWLTDILKLNWTEAHEEAHRLEHAISPRVEERLADILGMPSTCPHGKPIPGMPAPSPTHPFPLDQAEEGMTVVVERITEEAEADRRLLDHLWRTDVKPGARLRIEEVAPWAGTITMSGSGAHDARIVLGLAAAAKIWVYRPS
jgi:DtxR family Mn-dependent transcriptional regulator